MEALVPLTTIDKLIDHKKSDTIVIYGSGSSINDITDSQFKGLSNYDSCSFNWFAFSKIPVSYYLVREQANIPKRVHGKENVKNFYALMNKHYKDSYLIVHDLKNHSPDAYDYSSNTDKFDSKCMVVKDIKLKGNDAGVNLWRSGSIFNNGIYHGKTTMTNALHFAVWMGYRTILFAGVDLYDSKYFWMKDNKTRYSVRNKNKTMKSKHQTYNDTLNLVEKVKHTYKDINMYTYNRKSLLSNIIEVWN